MGGEWREMGGTSWAERMISRKLNETTISFRKSHLLKISSPENNRSPSWEATEELCPERNLCLEPQMKVTKVPTEGQRTPSLA